MGDIHVLAGVRKAHPHAVHVGSAGQFDPDCKIAFVGVHRRVAVQKWIDQRGDLDEMSITESVPALLAICCAHFLWVKKLPRLIGGTLDLLHDEFAQLNIVPGAIEQLVVIQLARNQHHIAGHLRALDLHRPAEQEAFFYRHVFKPPFQPVVLGFGHFKSVQQVKKLSGLRTRHHIISIPAFSACVSSLRIGSPSLR